MKTKQHRSPNGRRRINGRIFIMAGRGTKQEMERKRNNLILSGQYTNWRIFPMNGQIGKATNDYALYVH